jgi:nucleotide-binding universal stress UspA family protein
MDKILGSRPEIRISEGDAAAAILEVAGEGDEARTLLAVGSRGLGVIRRVRLGSVSTKILRAAGGPVLVYPHTRS